MADAYHTPESQLPDLLLLLFGCLPFELLGLFPRSHSHGSPIFRPHQIVAGELLRKVLIVPKIGRVVINVSDSCVHVLEVSTTNGRGH